MSERNSFGEGWEDDPEFSAWCYTARDGAPKMPLPLMTHMLYGVAQNDAARWDVGMRIAYEAFKAGKQRR